MADPERARDARALLAETQAFLQELRDLWKRGAIETNTTDLGLNGHLANVNAELESNIRAFLAEPPTGWC